MATNSGTKGNAKIWFIGGGVVVAAALVIFLGNYPPQPEDAAGTVGAAQRYSSTQITKDDVTVAPDALTTWLQSDTFDKIVKDPKAREIFTNAAFLQLSSDGFARNLMVLTTDATKGLQVAGDSEKLPTATTNAVKGIQVAADSEKLPLTTMAVQAVIGDEALKSAIGSPKVQAVFSDSRFIQAIARDNSHAVLNDAFVKTAIRENAALELVLANDAVRQYLSFVAQDSHKLAVIGDQGRQLAVIGDEGRRLAQVSEQGRALQVTEEGRRLAQVTEQGRMLQVADDARKPQLITLSEAAGFLVTDSAKLLVTNPAVVHQAMNNLVIQEALSNGKFLAVVSDSVKLNALMEEARMLKTGVRED